MQTISYEEAYNDGHRDSVNSFVDGAVSRERSYFVYVNECHPHIPATSLPLRTRFFLWAILKYIRGAKLHSLITVAKISNTYRHDRLAKAAKKGHDAPHLGCWIEITPNVFSMRKLVWHALISEVRWVRFDRWLDARP